MHLRYWTLWSGCYSWNVRPFLIAFSSVIVTLQSLQRSCPCQTCNRRPIQYQRQSHIQSKWLLRRPMMFHEAHCTHRQRHNKDYLHKNMHSKTHSWNIQLYYKHFPFYILKLFIFFITGSSSIWSFLFYSGKIYINFLDCRWKNISDIPSTSSSLFILPLTLSFYRFSALLIYSKE